jgi:hypothetical protein
MKRTLTLFCVLGLTSALQAQTDSGGPPSLPPGPLIQTRSPDFAEWVVTKKIGGSIDDTTSSPNMPPAGQGATKPQTTEDTVTKTHNVIRVVHLDTAKQPWTIWCHGADEYMIWPDGKSCGQMALGNNSAPNPFYFDFSASDFSGFDWVSLQNYTGIKSYQGTKCIVFQDGTPNSKKIAYIDFTSRLPIALQNGGEEYLYKWNAPPSDMLSFPSMVQALIDAGIKAQKQMAQKAVRPW